MKLFKTADCLEKLNGLFDRATQDFKTANALCDVLYEIEIQANKFAKMRQLILTEHYDNQEDGTWKPKKGQDLGVIQKKFNELNDLDFVCKKVKIPSLECISPRELYYLKEFFDFE